MFDTQNLDLLRAAWILLSFWSTVLMASWLATKTVEHGPPPGAVIDCMRAFDAPGRPM